MPKQKPLKPAKGAADALLVVLHGVPAAELPAWAQQLAGDGLRFFTRRAISGTQALISPLADIGALCTELQAAEPGCAVLLLRYPLQLDTDMLQRIRTLLDSTDTALALSTLSNAAPELNPYAGLRHARSCAGGQTSALVAQLADRRLHELDHWPEHFCLLSSAAVQALAGTDATQQQAPQLLRNAGGGVLLPEWWFIADPGQPLHLAARLDPHEQPRPSAWGGLRERLDQWLRQPAAGLPGAQYQGRSATLHVTHSWGGGVAVWVRSFITADVDQLHLQLRSEAPQSGAGAGQRLSLYLGNELRCPLDSWWLQPPIGAVSTDNAQYREVLGRIMERFAVGRVVVSSLIGHSLDALRTGLPTVQVLHDHFPAWPLLSIHPSEYDYDLSAALEDRRAGEQFGQPGPGYWRSVATAYREAVADIRLAAPSQSVIDIQRNLDAAWADVPIECVPHGLPPIESAGSITARARADGRLRLLIPGRVQTGKGADLLAAALPGLTHHAQVYLLGTGKGGERFFGVPGVHIVLEYQPEQLAQLVSGIGPHLAGLLSIVPETFSYTLSEMQALGIPVLATRLGSFVERVRDGEDGWLIEATPDALVAQVKALAGDPDQLLRARQALSRHKPRRMRQMLDDYLLLCPPLAAKTPPLPAPGMTLDQAQSASWRDLALLTREALDAAMAGQQALQSQVEQRTRWALDEEQRRQQEQQRRERWVSSLQQELNEVRGQLEHGNHQLDTLQGELSERTRHIERLDLELQARREELATVLGDADGLRAELQDRAEHIAALDTQIATAAADADGLRAELQDRAIHIARLDEEIVTLDQQLHAVQQELENRLESLQTELDHAKHLLRQLETSHRDLQQAYETVLNSHSWRLTRPLRAGRRMAANFMRARAWNPLRWPTLTAQTLRTLATQGLAGTLVRLQTGAANSQPAPSSAGAVTAAAPGPDIELPKRLPVSERPLISVIIPVYNHLDHTAACLQSLAITHCDTPFEVIVVDDASSDASAERLPGVGGLRYQRNPENVGFIHTCNNGAANARGEYLLFLNNDTQVQDGWLDRLLEVFETRSDAGLVGSRLVYPDGSLQECGGMIFSDGSGWNYGRGDDPDKPEYQYLREVDYCSGACLMLRAGLFRQLGGFDAHYAPAYYEDTDLAFKVRRTGLKVYVQPAATVVHFEGVSSGTDIQSGTKRYQAVNQAKFLERWADELRRQPPPIDDPQDLAQVRAARDHRLRGRVLVVDAYTPEPDQDSGSVRLRYLMQCLLELGYGVSFFPDNRAWCGRYTQALQQGGVQAWYDPWLGSPGAFLDQYGADYDYVIVSRHYIATHYLGPVRKYAPGAKFIFDTVDLHYLREQRHAELEDSTTLRQTARQTRRAELAVIGASDATLVVSPVEVALLAEDAPQARVFVLSNIHEVHGCGAEFAQRRDLYFVGGYQHPPNIDAVEWFVRDIWPLVHAQLPDVTFHIVGSKAPDSLRELAAQHEQENVRFHGFVEDLEPFLDGCRLSVAPLRYGAGVKGKVNQSMSHGQPVVATSVAMEGLHAEHGRDAMIADQAEDFAAAVVELYNDRELWERLSQHGLENVRAHFSLATARHAIEDMFTALAADD